MGRADDRDERADCGHDAPALLPLICGHLRDRREPWLSYYRCFTGTAFDHVLLCRECADDKEAGRQPSTSAVCESCLDYATTEVGDLVGVRGSPQVLERPGLFDHSFRTVPLSGTPLIDLSHAGAARRWFGLCADGTIVTASEHWTNVSPITQVVIPIESEHEPWAGRKLRHRLHVAPSGRFAAVVNDYGRQGLVVNLGTGQVTMELDGGDYHPDTVPFSLAFATFQGRDVLVHRTDWNRLDVSDAASGQLLTDRGPTSYQCGEPTPDHYLDYFHGGLYLSPDGRRLLDDGWVWHPIGIPEVWDLQRWLSDNVWESEDGPTKRSLDGRDYYWNHAMCWIDSHRVGVEGIGSDDDHMVAGARIFDVTVAAESAKITWPTAREITTFAGPAGQFFSDGQRLMSSADDGLSVWDLGSGARTTQLPEFKPQYHGPTCAQLVELRDDEIVVLSLRGSSSD